MAAGYERIGRWDASLEIPKEGRDAIKLYFEFLREGIVPAIVSYTRPMFRGAAKQALEEGMSPIEITKRLALEWAPIWLLPHSKTSALSHYAMGGSLELVEDPFVPIDNLYNNAHYRVVDYRTHPPNFGRTPRRNPIVLEERLDEYSTGDVWPTGHGVLKDDAKEALKGWRQLGIPIDEVVSRELSSVRVKATYNFQLLMDWRKMEARIEPVNKVLEAKPENVARLEYQS